MPADDLVQLTREIRQFAEARDWGKFHTPKNLAMAIAGEAGELAAEFQWMTAEESSLSSLSEESLEAIRFEIADVQIYLMRLADVLSVDISEVVRNKIAINETRFSK
ncbi:MAG: nucleotide pyrophosphohydrolase [Actinobacteria bacterium]|nr:nucleotide pyrophosphohydrolase [Actinomycetota bacterium]